MKITTYTGKHVNPLDLQPEDIFISDIAHASSQICRFNGHTSSHFSFAAHSVLLSAFCQNFGLKEAKQALFLHCAKAYMGDIQETVLETLSRFYNYEQMEQYCARIIFKKYGIPTDVSNDILQLDANITDIEKQLLCKNHKPQVSFDKNIIPDLQYYLFANPKQAEQMFFHACRNLGIGLDELPAGLERTGQLEIEPDYKDYEQLLTTKSLGDL